MFLKYKKPILISTLILTITLIGSGIFYYLHKPKLTELEKQGEIGTYILNNDFKKTPLIPIKQNESNYQLTDSLINGPTIEYANPPEELKDQPKNELNIEFPKNYQEPINIKLDEQRFITIKNTQGDKYNSKLITEELPLITKNEDLRFKINEENLEKNNDLGLGIKEENPENIDQPLETEQNSNKTIEQYNNESKQLTSYLKYQSKDKRVSTYYAYQKDNNQRTLKHWTIYDKQKKDQVEKEEYQFTNAKLKLNDKGEVEVYYFGDQDLKNEEVKAQVDSNLMARAQRTLQKELGEDILNTNNHTPDFIIPVPYYINKNQERKTLTWEIDQESNILKLNFKPAKDEYPIGLDPTIQFTAPGQAGSGDVISQSLSNASIGYFLNGEVDFNNDGKKDLVVSSIDYNGGSGRVYIFYNDGSISNNISSYDLSIEGEYSSKFGSCILTGDFNSDGRIDLIIGAPGYNNDTGRTYIFYNDGSIPAKAELADLIINGEHEDDYFGDKLVDGDFNNDATADLVISSWRYASGYGRVYIFYNDGSVPSDASGADKIITGERNSAYFGRSMLTIDINSDSKLDLALSGNNDYIYFFYNDGTIPGVSTMADFYIDSSGSTVGISLVKGDFNNDGSLDFVMQDGSNNKVYIFYCDGSIPSVTSSADITITGDSGSGFGNYLSVGDFNSDSKTDLVISASYYSSSTGRVYIFYNDGSIPTTTATADKIITGESSSLFGYSLATCDINNDGKVDLIVGAYYYSSYTGRVYIFYNDGTIPTTATTADKIINGENSVGYLGFSLASADLNNDDKNDLIVGSISGPGFIYIFYNDGNFSGDTSEANVVIFGEGGFFGCFITIEDLNNDRKKDLIIGALGYNNNTGRAYIFYNDGSIPTTAATADIVITGQSTSNYFGQSMICEDMNNDGLVDLIIGAYGYSTQSGRIYIFYNDGSIPNVAASADIIITGQSLSSFSMHVAKADLNNDGRVDLIISSPTYSSSTGRVYIFYNDGSIPTAATSADIIITGQVSTRFGESITTGDFNADGRIDFAVGASMYLSSTGRAYIFYNDGSIPTASTSADVTITGEAINEEFGHLVVSGDLNADGRVDLVVSSDGNIDAHTYIFYNDGSIPTTAITADVKITSSSFSYFDYANNLIVSDLNSDGKNDMAIGSFLEKSYLGCVYLFYFKNGQIGSKYGINNDYVQNSYVGNSLFIGDLNNDSKNDLVVGASHYSNGSGRIYIFYDDGYLESFASGANVIISGEINSYFGQSLFIADFNGDAKNDLAVGAQYYPDYYGRGAVYIFYNDGLYPSLAANADIRIEGENTYDDYFGGTLTGGDFDDDGDMDLAVGAYIYPNYSERGRVYIFYNDGSYPSLAVNADVKITSTHADYFGYSLVSGDMNYDGKTDLIVGADIYPSWNGDGCVFIFYNDGSYPTDAYSAELKITGETNAYGYFGTSLTVGDFNYDGRDDLAVGAQYMDNNNGAVYIFYNDGSIPTTTATADIKISGENIGCFGISVTSGDFNNDNRIDLVVGSSYYFARAGRAYIFYNDGSISNTASTADVIISGEDSFNYFGQVLVGGDVDNDGDDDLLIGSTENDNRTGAVYIFYNDGTYPSLAADAEHKITGDTYGTYFGATMTSGDFNNDSRLDLAVGAYGDSGGKGKVYLFYNDGSMPTSPDTADISITGESTENFFGSSLSSGDLNNDNQTDLIIGAKGYSTNKGRVYIIYNDGSYPTLASDADIKIDGENNNDNFGYSITTGDIAGDSRTDLIIGATGYSTNTGRTYIFNNDGSIPTLASNADTIITGENSNDNFGIALITGDFDYDMDNDLVIGSNYNNNTGRAYIFNNDGSYPNLALNSDIKIDGENTNNYFSNSFTKGDFNNDNRIDLVVGAYGYASNTGRVYIFNNDGSIPTSASTSDSMMTGEGSDNYFGYSLTSGDFNVDKKTDLAVGAYGFATNKGNSYIFYNDGSIPNQAQDADAITGGNASGDEFGIANIAGDFDGNNKTNLCVGYIGVNWQGGFYLYEVDAEGTKPNYTETKGGVNFNGGVTIK